mmetsp:Transcript_15994/g.21142  ORF Transcript_15994/g.21142 Transcript_15994/m.21142 type:complete len:785 (+) Transcript_15994:125-2479(+)
MHQQSQIRLAFSPTDTVHSAGEVGGTFDLTAVSEQSSQFQRLRSFAAQGPQSDYDSRPSTGGIPFYFHHDDEIRESDPAIGEAELARMREAEAEQCATDRFWGLDREFWEQRRACRGMYREDVASWRLREAAKISKQQKAWEEEDKKGRERQAHALGWHSQKTRESYLQFFYQAQSSEAIANYAWPSRPKMHLEDVVTREDYGLDYGYPTHRNTARRPVLPTAVATREGRGKLSKPVTGASSQASKHLFHMGGTPTKYAILQDRAASFTNTIAQRQHLQAKSTASLSALRTLGPGPPSLATSQRPRSILTRLPSDTPQPQNPEDDLESALTLTHSSSSKVLLEPLGDPAEPVRSSSFTQKKKKEKPKRKKEKPPVVVNEQGVDEPPTLNNQASKSNLGPRPLSGTLTESMKSPSLEAAPQRVRPHTAESELTGSDRYSRHSDLVGDTNSGREAPCETGSRGQLDQREEGMGFGDQVYFTDEVEDEAVGRMLPTLIEKKHLFVPLDDVQCAIVLPDNEEEILVRSFEIIDAQRRGYITEDELLFGVQENMHARSELKNTALWAIIKKRQWRYFGEMFAPLGNADLQAFLDFAYRVKTERKVKPRYLRPASDKEPKRPSVIPWSFQVGDTVEVLLLQGPIWYRARVIAANSNGTYDVECLSHSENLPQVDSFMDESRATDFGFTSLDMLEVQNLETQEEQVLSAFFQDHANSTGLLTPDKIFEIMDYNKNVLKKIPSFLAMYIYPKLLDSLISVPCESPAGLNQLEFVQTCLAISEIAKMNDLLKV